MLMPQSGLCTVLEEEEEELAHQIQILSNYTCGKSISANWFNHFDTQYKIIPFTTSDILSVT
jgi:hypothetical protein